MMTRHAEATTPASPAPDARRAPARDAAPTPLVGRFPALAGIPRIALGRYPTPVERITALDGGGELWIKREDLAADDVGGNKLRALEFLLAWTGAGDEVITVGARGSTHALATAVHAARLGARTTVVRWRQEMNADAERTAARLERVARVIDMLTPVDAIALASLLRMHPRARWVPAGGTTPLGMLGHVNAGLELAAQIRAGVMPLPARIIAPYGTGGTVAGLALGLAIARVDTTVIGVRVVPRVVANGFTLRRLIDRAAALIADETGEPVRRPPPERVRLAHDVHGGAYGRPHPAAERAAAQLLESTGIALDATYSAKAFAMALESIGETGDAGAGLRAPGPTLFWLTFDARWMQREAASETHDRAVR
jgi:D-cysteine desulfhydrase